MERLRGIRWKSFRGEEENWGLRRFWDGLRGSGEVGTLRSPGGAEGLAGEEIWRGWRRIRRMEGTEGIWKI